ncbi:MAG: type II secretion system protein GspE [Deltaproteobacteria bacterium CG_4_8_14_3_um_filter_51_11]|nr:type II secretion system ATPase GspE [bacterium]PIP48340.1 MAG: type II secretion system protein GspE [Deltaproteobacteria bacterium CG23_combo_of_CG06-09_8_20_14_all_51_20]PIX19152.1 MAG: type II secretion system protein GspE [Deltaproteobacteria bacterium CG_4_8_14_3_um_filter_51_11]PIY21802.1 MAG: type II secretion system protein GspE [Deltaproteobacteria bacterium CG_4_10_14_3_um_filter_51_14]PJB35602.1 MAG: type II secretion system protein GspE [Deltaproteobacteria bacterium CG_4_9_14_3
MRERLGDILKRVCALDDEILRQALEIQKERGGRIGEILIAKKAVTEADVLKALGIQFNLPVVLELSPDGMSTDFTSRVSIQFLKKYRMVPVIREKEAFVAVNDPLSFQPLDDLRNLLGLKEAGAVLAPSTAILSAINYAYDKSQDSAEQVIEEMRPEDSFNIINEIQQTGDLLDDTSDAPIIKLVNLMLSQAVKDRASDIHVEPFQGRLRIRYRVDGILYDMLTPPRHIQSALVSRIKIMAGMNIAEKRLPQDGRLEIRLGDKNIDIRVSTIPTAFGERVVLRLLDKSSVLLSVSELGMGEKMLSQFEKIIHSAYGIILVTGPTGSGKTTTLYGALSTINKTDINIITIEDPIEYQIEGISQIQVNPRIELTFARGLRSIVRQDPDVILVGEIRDLETAEIAIQSALTGHLVFSTLHTNDSASAVTRLIDMGIEPFLICSSVLAILGQRLVRVICSECREPYIPDDETLRALGLSREALGERRLFRGRGCRACLSTGYRGRTGIFEMMVISERVRSLILSTSDSSAIGRAAVEEGMTSLYQDGVRKVIEGITTVEEVMRVTRDS